MTTTFRRSRFLLVLLLSPVAARANVGPPSYGGHLVAEPVGIVGVAIVRETLAIDFRPLAAGGFAQVDAVYHLNNQGPQKRLDLIFASGSARVADFRVSLGGHPVVCMPAEEFALPESWKAPDTTPDLRGAWGLSYLQYGKQKVTPVAFTVTIPPGMHYLRVHYAAEVAFHNVSGDPTAHRQFAYVLAPARAWAGFGGLDVTVQLPEGWIAAGTPALAREGDTLKASFDELPADAIAITLRAPEGPYYALVQLAGWVLLGLAGLGGAVMCWRGGRSNGRYLAHEDRTGRPEGHYFVPIVLGFAWGFAVFAAGAFAAFGPEWVLPEGQVNRDDRYGRGMAMFGVFILSLLAVLVGAVVVAMTSSVVRKRVAWTDPQE